MNNPFDLKGKKVLVTGASSGIGASIAVECSKMGASLIITGRDEKRLNSVLATIGENTNEMIVADLENNQDLDRLTDNISQVDGLVFCAGINTLQPVSFIKDTTFDSIMNVNFKSQVMIIKRLLKKKRINDNSSIVFISSISADRPSLGNSVYSATKGAIDSFMRVLALELSPKGIRANSIHPAMVLTPLVEKTSYSEHYKEYEKRFPLRFGKPEDVAYAAIYLLSNASSWVTGTVLTLDGGISLT